MNLVNLEVIRRNAGTPNRATASGKLNLTYGDTLRLTIGFDYRGREENVTVYGSIGKLGLGFNEIISNGVVRRTPDSPAEFVPCVATIDLPITEKIAPGNDYDLMAKIVEYPSETEVRVENVVDITGIPPTFTLIQDTIYPFSYIYDGETEVVTAVFRSDPFTPSKWAAEKLAVKAKEEMEKDGRKILELRAYTDITPLFWTDYRIEIRTTLPPATSTGMVWWALLAIILASIGLVIAIQQLLETVLQPFQHEPISEEVKKTWSRETLIGAIQDFEKYLDRSPTPMEELEGVSDQGLRDYCDELAEVIVPPGVSWLPWAIIGGVAVLGVGAAVALSGRKK